MPKPSSSSTPSSPPGSSLQRRQRVQAAETGMAVLKGLADLSGRATLTALSSQVGESPAKVHRYLASLAQEGLVSQDAGTQQYFLGPEAIRIGVAAMRQADPIRAAEPALVRLRESLEVTCFIAVLGNKGATIVRFEEPGLPVTVNVRMGSVLPLLWSATGRAFLAFVEERALDAMALAELSTASKEQRELLPATEPIASIRKSVRRVGCASVRDIHLKGISAVAVPLFDHTGRVCAVLTALGATGGFDAGVQGPIAAALKQEAAAISAALGFLEGGS